MLTLSVLVYFALGLSQYPILERQVTSSIEDMPIKVPILLKHMAWILSMLLAIATEPIFSLIFYIFKPWVKR